MMMLVTLVTLVTMVSSSPHLLVLDQTRCYSGCGAEQCRDPVVGADQVVTAVNWTLERMLSPGNTQEAHSGLEVVDTCSDEQTAAWQIIKTLGRLSLDGSVNETNPLRVILASRLNSELRSQVSQLSSLSPSLVSPLSSPAMAEAAGSLVTSLGWSQVILVTQEMFSDQLMEVFAGRDICVLATAELPRERQDKDVYTGLLSGIAETGVTRVIVSGAGEDIARLVRNVYELNLNMSILALPWDGSVTDMPGSDMRGVEIMQMVQTFYNMPEFMRDNKQWSAEHPSTWQVSRALYGLLEVGEVNVDEDTAKKGLRLTSEIPKFRLEKFDLRLTTWSTVGVCEDGTVTWTSASERSEISDKGAMECYECQCVNHVMTSTVKWRSGDTWVTVLTSLASLGLLVTALAVLYLLLQCGQVLEGSQVTSLILLLTLGLIYLSLAPFCLLPTSSLVCGLRDLGPSAVLSLCLATLVSRSLLLATSDTDGLPGHASGVLQLVLGVSLVSVQAAVLTVTLLSRLASDHVWVTSVLRGLSSYAQCSHQPGSPAWLSLMSWPALLLLTQTILCPLIWRSRRNYREGVLFSLASLGLCLVTAGWLTVFFLVPDLYGIEWQEIATASGLVASASVILLLVFVPKIYMINKWGAGSEISLHLPATATSTLHTDTIDYVRGTDIYNTGDRGAEYDNNPGNRRGLSHILSHYGKTNSLYSEPGAHAHSQIPLTGSLYKLDSATEPDTNISWEPFLSAGRTESRMSRSSPYTSTSPGTNGGVSSMFISNMAGYGYTYDNGHLTGDNQTVKTVPSTKL